MSFPFIEHVVWLHSAGAEWAARARWRGAPIWHAQRSGEPLAACAELLEQAPRGRVGFLDRATVLLGFPHVHYLMLPWQEGLYSRDDWQGFAEATFSQQASVDPAQWRVQVANSLFGQQRLAVATPQDLLHDLRELFKLGRLPLVTCTPLLVAVAQQYWRRLPDDCVLAVPEAESLSCLYRQGGVIDQVCVIPTRTDSTLSDNLFTAGLLADRHAAVSLLVTNTPGEDRLGPVHPWLEDAPV
ncbi:hypothetical protein [Pseudomonas poae]|uniref:Uncharacterized protein n=1 Tax=Pseudomonas poae TaxID=200451 RepID=A0A2S9ELD5_9PSED|nr:hypothetical protein [Pseudomonas poae]PRA32415.1 hypothetical protein CQZ97_06945 [Pseudomonas poae]PRC16158.1 hypothetical protein CQZ99_16935 [Pseudomonas poae]